MQLDQSIKTVAQALLADGDAVVVSRLPTAMPAARKARRRGNAIGTGMEKTIFRIDFSQNHFSKKIDFFHGGLESYH